MGSSFDIKRSPEEVPAYNRESAEVLGLMATGGVIILGEDPAATSVLVDEIKQKLAVTHNPDHVISVDGYSDSTPGRVSETMADLAAAAASKPHATVIVENADGYFERSSNEGLHDSRLDMIAILARIANTDGRAFCMVLIGRQPTGDPATDYGTMRRNGLLDGFSATKYPFREHLDEGGLQEPDELRDTTAVYSSWPPAGSDRYIKQMQLRASYAEVEASILFGRVAGV